MCRRLRDATPLPQYEDLIRLCYGSNDFREGMEAFLNKRPARWTGT
jgi:enoyl-CoA hydratase/carnithine racemase